MKRMSKQLQRFLSICVIVSLLCCMFTNDIYANEFVATDSNSDDMLLSNNDYTVMPLVSGVDDAFLVICKIVFAACGVVVNGDNLRNLSNQFYNWLQARSEEWSDSLRAANMVKDLTIGASIAGVAHLIKAAKAFLNSITGYGTAAKSYTVAVPSGAQYETNIAAGLTHFFSYKYNVSLDGGNYMYADIFYKGATKPLAVYRDASGYYHGICDVKDSEALTCDFVGYRNFFEGFILSRSYNGSIFGTRDFKETVKAIPVPAFSTIYDASYYVMTGTVRDVANWLNPTANIELATPVVDAQTSDVTVVGDPSIVIPDLALLEQLLSNVATKEDIKVALKDIVLFEYSGSSAVPENPKLAYLNLCYIISAISSYCGVSLSNELIDSFISVYYGDYISGTSAFVEEQSEAILNRFVVINGGANKPDDDGDNNKYKVLKTFALALGAFLLSAGLVSDSIDFDNEPLVSNNLQIVDSFDDSGKEPFGNIDLSGIIGYLKSILDVLNNWINPLNLMDSLVSKFNLLDIQNNTVKAIKELPLQIANVLDLSNLFDNVINLLPDKLVNGFALPVLFNNLFSVIGSLPESIARLFGMSTNFSLVDLCNDLGQKLLSLPDSIAERIKDIGNSEPPNDDIIDGDADNGFKNFLSLFMLAIFILVLLIILFINFLRFIILVFNIPASTSILNADLLSGINYLKSLQLPIFGMSLYSFLLACAYFLIFMSIVTVLRKKIDKIHI